MGESGAAPGRVIIVMPTYNERQNLELMAGRIRDSVPDAHLLVVDDNSPDGTGDLADKLAEVDSRVQAMHRTEKAGLGRAYVAGFNWALNRGYDLIVEMDADGSHRPEDLPSLLAAAQHADAVIGVDALDQAGQLALFCRVGSGRRLVEQDHTRAGAKSTRNL